MTSEDKRGTDYQNGQGKSLGLTLMFLLFWVLIHSEEHDVGHLPRILLIFLLLKIHRY